MQTRSFRRSGEPAWVIASSNACEGLGPEAHLRRVPEILCQNITMNCERTDRWTKMRPARARSSAPGALCHMLSSADCIITTSESSFRYTGIEISSAFSCDIVFIAST